MGPEVARRFVFDTNTIVSALLFEHSVPAQAFFAALRQDEILLSFATFRELGNVLRREKFDRYLTAEERDQFLLMLLRDAAIVEVAEEIRQCRDPKDDKFLDVATAGGASCIVSGDKDLLALNPFRGIRIIPAAQFIQDFLGQ